MRTNSLRCAAAAEHDGGRVVSIQVAPRVQAQTPELRAPDGGEVTLVGRALEFRDAEGRLLVRYQDGSLEVAPASGDLHLKAPTGRVHIQAAADIRLEAGRDLSLSAARSAELSTTQEGSSPTSVRVHADGAVLSGRNIEVRSQRLRQIASTLEVIATTIRSSASRMETQVKDYEVTAERKVLRVRELAEDVTDLLETRAGRIRTLVKSVFRLHSKSTDMTSDGDTAIDGRRVLLG